METGGTRKRLTRFLFAVGCIVIVVGSVSLAISFQPSEGTKTMNVPPASPAVAGLSGTNYWVIARFSSWSDAVMSWSIKANVPEDHLWSGLIGQSTYGELTRQGFVSTMPLYSSFGNSSFSIGLPTTGTYYFVFSNSEPWREPVNITFHYRVTGVNLTFLVPGALLIVTGIVVLVVSLRMSRKGRFTWVDDIGMQKNERV
jgi:hypothetical protein